MPLEIEAKMRLSPDQARQLEHRLLDLGAQSLGEVLEENIYFDTPDQQLRDHDRGLRIRTEIQCDGSGSRTVITCKGPRAPGPLKTRPEHETAVADAQTTINLLHELGYITILQFQKRRRRWHHADCEICLDELPHLGLFIEIEGPDEQIIMSLRRKLGLSEVPLVRETYTGMLFEHLRTHNLPPMVRFENS